MRARDLMLAFTLFAAGGCATVAPESDIPTASPDIAASPVSGRPSSPSDAPFAVLTPAAPVPWTFSPPSVTGEASAPSDLQRTAATTWDDIRVTVTLQRNPLPAGQRSWVKTTVTNMGRTTATWFHDGCATSVGVSGRIGVDWRSGTVHQGQAQTFKDAVLGRDPGEQAYDRPALEFVPKDALARGAYGCSDIGIEEKLRPGQSIKATRWWSGVDPATRAEPPSGPVTLDIWSGYYWRGAEPDNISDRRIQLTLEAWVTGGWSPQRPSPAEIVDAALSDAGFVAYLDTQTLHSGRETILWYDADHDRWEVGVLPWYESDPPRIHGVLVDGTTGAVLGPLDRPWDKDVDGYPY